jgi:hypothetical protein
MPADFLSQNVVSQIYQAKVSNLRIEDHQVELE